MTTALSTQKTTQAQTILERCVCLVLTCKYMGNIRSVDTRDLAIQHERTDGAGQTSTISLADKKKALHVTKMLVDSRELTTCTRVISAAQAYLRSVSLSGHRIFGPGTYLVPSLHVDEVEARLAQFQGDLAKAVTALAGRWETILAKRAEELGPLFNAKEYLTQAEVTRAFDIDWTYTSFAAPERLEEVSRAAAARADAKYQTKQELTANLNFVADSFGEHTERNIEHAKIEISAYATGVIQRTGIAALKERGPIELPPGDGEER